MTCWYCHCLWLFTRINLLFKLTFTWSQFLIFFIKLTHHTTCNFKLFKHLYASSLLVDNCHIHFINLCFNFFMCVATFSYLILIVLWFEIICYRWGRVNLISLILIVKGIIIITIHLIMQAIINYRFSLFFILTLSYTKCLQDTLFWFNNQYRYTVLIIEEHRTRCNIIRFRLVIRRILRWLCKIKCLLKPLIYFHTLNLILVILILRLFLILTSFTISKSWISLCNPLFIYGILNNLAYRWIFNTKMLP